MKLVRFRSPDGEGPLSGELRGETVIAAGAEYRLDRVVLLPPCVPSKIVCVGRNYAAHAEELGNEVPEEPLFFFKPPSAVIGPEEEIVLPDSPQVDYEAELAVVIGKRCRNVPEGRALDVVLGYTCLNDVTDRAAQRWERNWVRAKGFDTSAPLGPTIRTRDEGDGPFHVSLRLNGVLRQDGSTGSLIYPIPKLIATISSIMTLEPGDVIATGTPAGVGRLAPGDTVEVTIDGIGTLRNRVRSTKRSREERR
ncbi:2-hydroxyhepta-2,4-diene-1,7-dioate isomerase [Candidatus Acetothermia bacterium]|nr:MAG: 2-hydroxyhepta-2,4-diene-1,7-dioate isomerase [Candidatus Acetothermia bacterium]